MASFGADLTAKLEALKAEEAKAKQAQKELIQEEVPAIITSILEMVEVLNAHNDGDKYSLKRGIYNVDAERIHRQEKGTAMGAPSLS